MHYARVMTYVSETVWALLPSKLSEILGVLRIRADGGDVPEEQIRAVVAARPQNRGVRTMGTIGVLPIMGVLHHRADLFRESSGGTSVERLSAQFGELIRDPSVSAVVLDLDTPGGDVRGISEFAAEIRAARNVKPI